jgi:hypothetical protein
LQQKVDQLVDRRNQHQSQLQQSIQAQAQAQQHAQAQQMMMSQNGMQGQVSRAMNQQPAQQGFHHLQHQMQASPIPGQQPQQIPMGMPNDAMSQNMSQQQQFQMSMQQPHQPQPQAQNVPTRPQNGQPPLSQADATLVQEIANRLMAQASLEEKNQIRIRLQSQMDAQQFQRYQAQGLDPIVIYYRNQALARLRQEKQARMQAHAQAQQLALSQQQPQNIPTTAPPMQQQRSMNPSPLNGQTQPPTSIAGNQEFGSFLGNMGNLMDQQQQGVIAQEAGQMVVPASGAQRNGTPQPGVMPGQQISLNDQRAVVNPNVRAQQQQQQQMFNAQQAQQRMQHAQQQSQQAAARAAAQTKAQQMALQGQPGGMGPGPMPSQQSPGMGTLNTPLRTPSQQGNNAEPPQINPNSQFGQPLDPRFMQPNQKQLGPGGTMMNGSALNPMFAGMAPEQQQRLAALPPDKLNEVVNKWNEQRAQMNANNLQSGRPPVSMQGNNKLRTQQVPQPGQFNPNALSQFLVNNPGQHPPPSLTAGMSQQQQQIYQAQLQRMNSLPRNVPPNVVEQQRLAQLDNMDIPPTLKSHQLMPRGIPPEFQQKWGQLKQWAQLHLPPDASDGIRGLQKMHYQGIMRQRAQQAGQQPLGIPTNLQGNQLPPSVAAAGMSAPVAPMGQSQVPFPNGVNMLPGQVRQPTLQEIQAARNHPSGRMAAATDDQIRALLVRNQMNNQQSQRQAMMLQMANQASLMNGQQPRAGVQPGQVPQPGNSIPAAQNLQQSKQSQPGSEAAVPTSTANNARVARPPLTGRAALNSSPAQPPRSLKRPTSDDVVEVPNPNARPSTQPLSQQNHGQKPATQPTRYTDQQIAALNPEERKKYEQSQRMFEASRAPPMEQLKQIMKEESKPSNILADIPMDQETKQIMVKLLREIHAPLINVMKAVPKWFAITHDTARARQFFRTVSILSQDSCVYTDESQRYRLQQQFRDAEMTQPKDTFSIKPTDVEQARSMLGSMVKDLSDRFPTMKKPDVAQAQSAISSQTQQSTAAPTVPLNAANLQQQQQQLNKLHQRSGSRSSHTPAAPTSSQPPFQFGGASSPLGPNGVPQYAPKAAAIKQEDLHIPARKKQRLPAPTNNSTPVQNIPASNASPQVNKSLPPEAKRQPIPDSRPKPSLCCAETDCDRHQVTFETEEELKAHTEHEHIRPLQDPAKYAREQLATMIGLNSQGQPQKPDGPASTIVNSTIDGTLIHRHEGTPAGTNTSMNRQISSSRQGNSNLKPPSEAAKNNLTDLKNSIQETVYEADPWANSTISPYDISQNFAAFESGASGAISDMNVYRSITPNDTPESSKDGLSEPNSDVSEGVGLDINLEIFDDTWQPFASDADFLADMNSFNVNGEQDLLILEDQTMNLQPWDDLVDPAVFEKQFQFESSLFSMIAD